VSALQETAAAEPASSPPRPDLRSTGDRIETLLASFAGSGRPAQERAEDLVRLVAELYGAGLERLLDIAYDAGALTPALVEEIAADELVASLLLVHGLHPYDLQTRVRRALAGLRPELAGQGVVVELSEIDDEGVVRLRLSGASGCGAAGIVDSVTAAVEAAAPDATAVECQQEQPAAAPTLIPVSSLSVRTRQDAPGEAVRA